MNITFITDPLLTTAGATRPPSLLAMKMQKDGHKVTLVSLSISKEVMDVAKKKGIQVKSLGFKFNSIYSVPIVEAWAKSLIKPTNTFLSNELCDDEIVVNTSSCVNVNAHVYYAQGPITRALDDMRCELPARYKSAYFLVAPVLKCLEKKNVRGHAATSKVVIANSKFCASMYEDFGVKIGDVIPPPLDCTLFKPETSEPLQDYVLTYFGVYNKETKFAIIKRVADQGVKVKAFGYKAAGIPNCIAHHPNIEFLGAVSEKELVDLYSNALYVLFTFAHEPFGYIPIESMACGTPVLTHNTQGPSESVIDKSTGWLANDDTELVNLAVKIWKKEYPKKMRKKCVKQASLFDVEKISEKWVELVKKMQD